jgi:uncharacterized protein YbjT (DUF2867 family)
MTGPIVIAGASGFVGSHLVSALGDREVRCGSRDPVRAQRRDPRRTWVSLDLDRPETLEGALDGADALVFLVHSLGAGHSQDLIAHEEQTARRVLDAATRAGVRRVVYLGGPQPQGFGSAHLSARLRTGEILRSGAPSTIELRASMIIGYGSESWQICRDLAFRLPVMVAPRWTERRTQPIGIADVVVALVAAIDDPLTGSAVFDLPGPETLSARQILARIGAHAGFRPIMFPVPLLTPRLSSLWLRFVTQADYEVARQLVDGFGGDLLCEEPGYWGRLPGWSRTPLDEASASALADEPAPSGVMRAVEALARGLGRTV